MSPDVPEVEKPQAAVSAMFNKQDTRQRENRRRGQGSYISAGLLPSRANVKKSSILGSVLS